MLVRRLASIAVIGVVFIAALLLLASPTRAASPLYVALTFDDGTEDHYSVVKPILAAYGIHGTFFINSGLIGTPGSMTWEQVAGLAADGNEIGGHSLYHDHIASMSYQDARFSVCQDRVNLFNHGHQAVSFAFPYAQSSVTARQAVIDCGYNSARLGAGIGKRCRINCSETFPPSDPFGYLTVSILGGTSVSGLEQMVISAEQADPNRAGWLEFVFHQVGSGRKTFSSQDFSAFLSWLNQRGSPTRTISQIIGGTVQPPVAP